MKTETIVWLVLFVVAGVFLAARTATSGMGFGYEMPDPHGTGLMVDATAWQAQAGVASLSPSRTAGIWIAAFFTLCIFSFMYRDNALYKLAEAVVVGVSAGYWMVVSFWDVVVPNLLGRLAPTWVRTWAMPGLEEDRNLFYLFPLLLGVLLLWRLSPRGSWIARWPLAFIIGTTAGLRMIFYLHGDFLAQINASVVPLLPVETVDGAQGIQWIDGLNNLIMLLAVLCCLVYFFFSAEHKGAVGRVAKVGIWVLMVTFGAAFGYTVMGRIALLAMRLEFLFDDWLWIIDPLNLRPPY
jgi:hypothetical protein